jgi:nucleoside-diphosphate-sugar epimerase
MIEQSAQALGRRAVLIPLPLRPVHGLVRILRRMGLSSPIRPEQLLRLEESKAVDITPARRDLGFSPRSFAEGIGAEAEMLFGQR